MPRGDASYIKEKLRQASHGPGVYIMKDRLGGILYVGKAGDLKRRISSYFQNSRRQKIQQPKVAAMLDLIRDFETIEVRSEAEALLLESRLIKHWKPKYNTELIDDKRYPLIRVDMENPLPRFRIVRLKTSQASRYFGPFAFASQMRKTLDGMRRQFGIMLADASPVRQPDGKWLLYDDIRGEIFGHPNLVTEEEYRARVDAAVSFMEGRSREWLDDIRARMREASENREYEEAAAMRDMAVALEKTLEPTRKFTAIPQTTKNSETILAELREHLNLPTLPDKIECFDISHISGSYCVASMVRFTGGMPDKKNYRRFRIKTFEGNDDFRAMEEVVGRRYQRLADENTAFPDLLVIDGGLGQIASALRAFLDRGLEPPFMIGLAKKHERIFFADGRPYLDLPPDDESRKLLQRVRDEAHRFANTYNAELRSKQIRDSILDDFAGIGPVKKHALFAKFKSVAAMRDADVDELAKVEGIGDKLAGELWDFLNQ